MNAVSMSHLVDGVLVLLPAAAQAGIAWQQRAALRAAFPDGRLARRLPHPAVLVSASYALAAVVFQLVRASAGDPPSSLRVFAYVSIDALLILGLAGYVHLARREAQPHSPPSRRWLVAHYGAAAALCLLAAAFPSVIPLPTFAQQLRAYRAAFLAYYMTTTGRLLGHLVGPAGARPGIALFTWGMVLAAGGGILLETAGASGLTAALITSIGLTFAAPFAAGRLLVMVRAMLGLVAVVAVWRIASAGIGALDGLAAAGVRLPGPPPLALAAAAISLLQGLVWGICARRAYWIRQRAAGGAALAGVLTMLLACMAAFSVTNAICWLFAPAPEPIPPWLVALYFLHDWLLLAAAALAIHVAQLLPGDVPAPTGRWVALDYLAAGIVGLASVLFIELASSVSLEQRLRVYVGLQNLYVIAAVVFLGSRLVRFVRPGRVWRPGQGILGTSFSRFDVLVFRLVIAGVAAGWMLSLPSQPPGWAPTPLRVALTAITGTAALFPVALRALGEVVRVVLGTVVVLALATATYVGIETIVAPVVGVGLDRLGVGLAAAALALAFVPLQAWLRGALERTIFRRSQRRRERLQAFLHELPPELGTLECSRRAVAALVNVLRCPWAAVLLGSGECLSSGTLTSGTLERAWLRVSRIDARLERPLVGYELATLPLPMRETLAEAGVTAVLPLRSPRRYWGHLVVTAGLLATAFGDEDLEVAEAFADQLALILDTTELLERSVSVERSLAHAEKLAAVGETAARIAHDIRNPVTAARSLAQQLAREPAGAFHGELQVIVEELDRVERQVADLLRFTRREDLRFESVDLGALAQATVRQLRPRLRAAGVAVSLDLEPTVVVRADRERIRQLIVNLVENAADALCDAPLRELSLRVATMNGSATLRVSDTGPGVSVDALSHLFEPFFSLKPHGTGLGLAIAKRTVDAHGGRISAAVRPGGGMVFDVDLPAVSGDAA